VTVNEYLSRPIVLHEGKTLGGPWIATLEECKNQCDIAPMCKSFSYSESKQHCSIKDMCVQAFAPAQPDQTRGDWMTYYKPCAETHQQQDIRTHGKPNRREFHRRWGGRGIKGGRQGMPGQSPDQMPLHLLQQQVPIEQQQQQR